MIRCPIDNDEALLWFALIALYPFRMFPFVDSRAEMSRRSDLCVCLGGVGGLGMHSLDFRLPTTRWKIKDPDGEEQ